MKHVGILSHSFEGATLCYRTMCLEGVERLGPHQHPEITLTGVGMHNMMDAWDRDDRPTLRAMFAYDIGKLAVPDYIISKPGKLTPEEFDKMKIHTIVGAAILEQVGFPYGVPAIVRSHHERWDGSGYAQLEGEAIPISARIVAVADVFDVLTHDRPYRKRWPQEEASAEIARQSGSQFDPRIVQAFLAWRRREERPKRMMETVLGG